MRLDRDRRLLEKRGRRKTIKSTRQSAAAAATVEGVWGEKTEKGSGTNHGLLFNFFFPPAISLLGQLYVYYIRPFRKRHVVAPYILLFCLVFLCCSFNKNVHFLLSFRIKRTLEMYMYHPTLNIGGQRGERFTEKREYRSRRESSRGTKRESVAEGPEQRKENEWAQSRGIYIYGRRVHILSNCGVRLYYYLKYYIRAVLIAGPYKRLHTVGPV
jgi:hypothetical protein